MAAAADFAGELEVGGDPFLHLLFRIAPALDKALGRQAILAFSR